MNLRWIALALALCAGCRKVQFVSQINELRGKPYALDSISRELGKGAVAGCPEQVEIRSYAGQELNYGNPVLVARSFVPKLQAFERVVAEVAQSHYGRAPDRILHFGTRMCRSVRGSTRRLSEHALGNAIDVSGFQWSRTRKLPGLPPGSERAFKVTVLQHWSGAGTPEAAEHRRFLHDLVERTVADEIFRGVIGPGREGHADHLHFDAAPWGYTLF
jgi:hypothetical protein